MHEPYFRKRLILDGKVSGFGNRYDTLEQLLKEAKQLGHINERKYDEVEPQGEKRPQLTNNHAHCSDSTNIALVVKFFVRGRERGGELV